MKTSLCCVVTLFFMMTINSCSKQEIQDHCINKLCQRAFRFDSLSQNGGAFLPLAEIKTYTFTTVPFGNQPDKYELVAANLSSNYSETFDWKWLSDSANTVKVSIRNGDELTSVTIVDSTKAIFDYNLPYPARHTYKMTILP